MANQTSEILNLKFETMAHGGEAIARDENGRVIFVPYAIAGETARVEIVEAKRGFARGRVVELLEASAERITPRCPHFPPDPISSLRSPFCGGCQWQHIAYRAQLEFKTQIVREQFARVAKMPEANILPTRPARREWFYRNNMQFVLNDDGALCLQAPDSHTPVPIEQCFIMHPALGEMKQTLELDPDSFTGVTLRVGENTGDHFIILESDDDTVPEIETDEPVSIAYACGDVTVPLVGKTFLSERVGARTFEISPNAFFQVNTPMAEELIRRVENILAPRADDVLLDAYGGVGLFGLSLASRVARVIEIEENPYALENAQANAADLNNVEFHAGRVEHILPKLDANIELAIVDPPRAGLDRFALDALTAKRPRTIAYVSCDPATLARDAARLVQQGYTLESVQPVDMFPQTYHIECVAAFRRADV
jgi:23S rRNA (uracil1939-C5)-methyltransferase